MTEIPFPKVRTLWPLGFTPLLLGTFYLSIAYPRFCNDTSFIWEHLLVLAFWLATTIALMFLVRELLIRLKLRFVFLPAVVIPTLSCFTLYIIYASALIGSFSWGSIPNYKLLLGFASHLFELADNFEMPHALVIGFFAVPLGVLSLIYLGGVRDIVVWHWSVREKFKQLPRFRRLVLSWAGALFWIGCVTFMKAANPSIRGFGHFSYDPIVNFFKSTDTVFPITRERVFWSQKDRKIANTFKPRVPRVHNIFLFVVDALRADHLSLYGYPRQTTPFISKFLSKANAYSVDWALSNGLDTITGLQCLITSKEPVATSQYDYTLPDYLSDQGFNPHLILAGDHTWQLKHNSFGQKIELFYDGSEHPGPHGACDDSLVVQKVAELPPDNGGYHFFYIHLISVHQLSTLETPFKIYQPIENIVNMPFLRYRSPREIAEMINMYDDRILQMDDAVRQLLTQLGQKGYLRDYIAVLTADHGQNIGEKQRYGHGFYASAVGMHVPLIFFGSKPLPPLAQSHFAVQLDIAPTLVDLAGLEIPSTWQGQSLLQKRTNPWSYHLSCVSQMDQEGAVVYDDPKRILKYSRIIDKSGNDSDALYNLDLDPSETNNLIDHFDSRFLSEFRDQANEHFSGF